MRARDNRRQGATYKRVNKKRLKTATIFGNATAISIAKKGILAFSSHNSKLPESVRAQPRELTWPRDLGPRYDPTADPGVGDCTSFACAARVIHEDGSLELTMLLRSVSVGMAIEQRIGAERVGPEKCKLACNLLEPPMRSTVVNKTNMKFGTLREQRRCNLVCQLEKGATKTDLQ
ncbi:hypothetical protein B296_00022406 [Ensete ventricosum]|uniref:Uncharacterized protein n=1 Tax=Ensete ventricosum TaxID=4639 RepID=A0A427AP70_ENSVE|nr:hypothetical protein B296_00022406 [Ensete ventricosum]